MSSTPYTQLSLPELKQLKKLHKDNPPQLALIEQAITAALPYTAGRLTNEELSQVGIILGSIGSILGAPADIVAKAEASIKAIERFRIGYIKPTAAPIAPVAPVVTPSPASEGGESTAIPPLAAVA